MESALQTLKSIISFGRNFWGLVTHPLPLVRPVPLLFSRSECSPDQGSKNNQRPPQPHSRPPTTHCTVTATGQEAFYPLPATCFTHPQPRLSAPDLKAYGCNVNRSPPLLPNTSLHNLNAGHLCISSPLVRRGDLIRPLQGGDLSPCVAWVLGPHLPCTLLLSIKPTQSKAHFQALLLRPRVGLVEI